MNPRRLIAQVAIVLALPVGLGADTLYLRNGQRIEGELVGVRNGQIEFEERRTFGGSRTVRFDRDEVDRIDFDNRRYTNNTTTTQQLARWPSVGHARAAAVVSANQRGPTAASTCASARRFISKRRAASDGARTARTVPAVSAIRRPIRTARWATATPPR